MGIHALLSISNNDCPPDKLIVIDLCTTLLLVFFACFDWSSKRVRAISVALLTGFCLATMRHHYSVWLFSFKCIIFLNLFKLANFKLPMMCCPSADDDDEDDNEARRLLLLLDFGSRVSERVSAVVKGGSQMSLGRRHYKQISSVITYSQLHFIITSSSSSSLLAQTHSNQSNT